MLSAKILNSQASLNNFKEVKGVDFKLNDGLSLVFRIRDPELGDRFVPPTTAIVTLIFRNFDATTFTKVATVVDAQDASIQTVTLLPADTTQLYGGNVEFTVDLLGDGSKMLYGTICNALRKQAVSWGPND